jgi:hypothetical protein
MKQWEVACILASAGLWACSADADMSGGTRGGGSSLAGSGARAGAGGGAVGSAGSAGSIGFGNSTVPVTPPPEVPLMPQPSDAGGECGAVSQTAENTLQPVDIIIGVDTSGSMDEEIVFVQQNLNAFSQQIVDSGIDVHVIMLATEGVTMAGGLFGGDSQNAVCIGAPLGSGMCPGDSNPPSYTHVNTEVGSNDVLNVYVNAYPQYKASLREGSLKTFVSVTDDDATDGPYNSADAFMAAVNALEPAGSVMWSDWRYSGIYCFSECEEAAATGTVHADLVARTMGVGGDLCLQDFATVFDTLAQKVIETVTLACDWAIPPAPGDEAFDAAKTNVRLNLDGVMEPLTKAASAADCADLNAWHYDDEANPARVVACPATCSRMQAAQNANVDILFGCETVLVVPI